MLRAVISCVCCVEACEADEGCVVPGLMGGHSGLNINEDRGNAVRFAARIADTLLEAAPGARLVQISGGDKRNAIPREATALLLVCFHTLSPVMLLHYSIPHKVHKCDPGKFFTNTFPMTVRRGY